MDDPSLRQILERNQEGIAGAAALQLVFALCYAVVRQLDFWRSVQAAGIGMVFAGALWLFLAEMLQLKSYYIVPVSIGCGFFAYPVVNAYVRRSDSLADDVVGGGAGFIKRWLKRIFGGGGG